MLGPFDARPVHLTRFVFTEPRCVTDSLGSNRFGGLSFDASLFGIRTELVTVTKTITSVIAVGLT